MFTPDAVPLLPRETREEPAIGFRLWIPIDGDCAHCGEPTLKSVGPTGYSWVPGVNTAQCRRVERGGRHELGTLPERCRCGMYAYHWLPQGQPSFRIVGAVMGMGETVIYPEGFRAVDAEIIGLLAHPQIDVTPFARRYGVPVLDRERLLQHAYEFGRSAAPRPLEVLAGELMVDRLWRSRASWT